VGFGLWTLRGDCLEEGDAPKCGTKGAFLCVFATFFMAELGDKTMLGTVALASTYSVIPVWLGSSAGMVVADGLAILVGQVLGARLPEKAVRMGAAMIFLGYGAFSIINEGRRLPLAAWAVAGVSIALLAYIFLRPRPKRICLAPEDLVSRE
jgi:putative Ca2+/H+ antiporter (TMEM165/GDT1 family)